MPIAANQNTGVATDSTQNDGQVRTHCKHCGGPIEKPRKGKEYCKPKCRFAQWDKDHPRMVRWK